MQFSDHLVPALRDAAALAVERACEPEWEGESQLGRVRAAVHVLDALEAGTCAREQIAELAARAVSMQGDVLRTAVELNEPVWPTTRKEADALDERARLTRELIELRDVADSTPPQEEERDEPG
jgi:hypothetical protein